MFVTHFISFIKTNAICYALLTMSRSYQAKKVIDMRRASRLTTIVLSFIILLYKNIQKHENNNK